MAACVGKWVCTMKTPDRNDLKLGIKLQPIDFGFKRARVEIMV